MYNKLLGKTNIYAVTARMQRHRLRFRPGRPWHGPPHKAAEGLLTLSDYKEGQRGRILEVRGEGRFRKRLLEMGFVRGTEVYVEKYAPLLDPVEFVVKGYHVSLRRQEAAKIVMSEPV